MFRLSHPTVSLASQSMLSGALESPNVLLSHPTVALASHTTIILNIHTSNLPSFFFTLKMLSLLKKRPSPRVVTVASQSGLLKPSYSNEKKGIFLSSASSLTYEQLDTLMEGFIVAAESNNHKEEGYPNSCYGISKAGVIAFTKILSRLEPSVLSNCLCPGYCDTDMTSHGGDRTPEKGAETALYLALSEDTLVKQGGKFFYDLKEIQWESE